MSGCSIKKKENASVPINEIQTLSEKPEDTLIEILDSDNDGISDSLEKTMGTNPNVADIPKISIGLVQEISIGAIFKNLLGTNQFSMLKQTFSEVDAKKGDDLDFLKVLRKKIIINQYNYLRNIKAQITDIIIDEDLRSNILSSWTDELYYPFLESIQNISKDLDNDSGKFTTSFKIKISNALNVTEISDISMKSFFYDYEKMEELEIYNHYLVKNSASKEKFNLSGNESYSPVTLYPLIANELKAQDILTNINNRSEIGIKFTDYNYISSGVKLNYSEVLSKVFDGNARIIYSDGINTEIFFVSSALTLKSALVQLGKKIIQNKNGDIYSIDSIESNARYPIDIDNLKIDDYSKGIWSVFGDADSLDDQLKAQGAYIVSYSKIKEILRSSKKSEIIHSGPIVNSFIVDNVFEGDELLIDVEDIKISSISETLSQINQDPECHGSGCNFIGYELMSVGIFRGSSCNCSKPCTEINSSSVINEKLIDVLKVDITKWFKFEDSYGEYVEARVYRYGNKVKVIFNSLNKNLKNKIKINFKDPLDSPSVARVGRVGGSCGGVSYSNQEFINQYKFSGEIKIFGINRY